MKGKYVSIKMKDLINRDEAVEILRKGLCPLCKSEDTWLDESHPGLEISVCEKCDVSIYMNFTIEPTEVSVIDSDGKEKCLYKKIP